MSIASTPAVRGIWRAIPRSVRASHRHCLVSIVPIEPKLAPIPAYEEIGTWFIAQNASFIANFLVMERNAATIARLTHVSVGGGWGTRFFVAGQEILASSIRSVPGLHHLG